MPLGDSISKDDGAGNPGAYRTPLWELAQEDGVPIDFVGSLSGGPVELPDKDHEGHGGFSIQQLDGIVAPTLRAHRPNVILLHIGSNDMYKNNVPLASRQLSALVDHITAVAPNARLYVAGIIPQPKYENQVRKFNTATRAMVRQKAAMGVDVRFVDMHAALGAHDLHDGLHPTPEGYEKMAEAWWSAITADYPAS
ncbi:MAG: SGNH/GDSL hydrolase family protein [Mycobacteriales bacterium]